MTSSNFTDTAPQSVTESKDPDVVIRWINQLPLPEAAGRVILCEWAHRNSVPLTCDHYKQILNPMGDLLRANLSKVPKP